MSENAPITEVAKPKHAGGRPQKFTPAQIAEIQNDLYEYIVSNDDPTIVKFVANYYKYDVVDQYLHEHVEFAVLVKRAIKKQEAYLLDQNKNPAMAIFRLKQPQHGYSDRQDFNIQGNVNSTVTHTIDPKLAANFTEYLKNQTRNVIDQE